MSNNEDFVPESQEVNPSVSLTIDEAKFVLMLIEALVTRGAVKSEELLELGNFRQLILNKLA